MALFESLAEGVLESSVPSWAVGLGAVLVAPVALPALRPLAKGMVKGSILVVDKTREAFSEAGEQWGDLVAEVRSEMAASDTEAAGSAESGGEAKEG